MLNKWVNFQFSIMKKLWDLVQENRVNIQHNVSFDWFLSRLEWMLTKTFDILPEIIMEYQI